jgi:acetyltransferase
MIKLEGYELILVASPDEQFGPVLLFGTGGQLVEVFKDRALALPPLNATLARRMMEQTRIYTALKGVRGRKPVDLGLLEQIMVRFSELVAEQRWIKEIDINPMLASPDQIIALDARVVLYDKDTPATSLPKLAIRPYPVQYVVKRTLKDGTDITIRPIRPEDEPMMVRFHQTLSERSVRLRYFHPLKLGARIAHERLVRVCFADYDREMPLVAEHRNDDGSAEIIGIGRISNDRFANLAEFAVLVSDQWQNKGVGTHLLNMLVQISRDERFRGITADMMPDNIEMQRVSEKAGFRLRRVIGEPMVHAELMFQEN